MCQEAVCMVLSRAASEPGYLRQVFHQPEVALDGKYDLTLEERRAILSGSVSAIEAAAGRPLSAFLRELLQNTRWEGPTKDSYFEYERKKSLVRSDKR